MAELLRFMFSKLSEMNSPSYPALIIDDDPDLCHLMVRILALEKIIAATAHTLEEAEYCLGKIKPRLIFLDNNLPDGTGTDFMRKIAAFDQNIRVIMITGDTTPGTKEKAFHEGIHAFLLKPFNGKNIMENVNEVMGEAKY